MKDKIKSIIHESIDSTNEELNVELQKSDDSVIFGDGSPLDSLGVLTFIVELEKKFEEAFGLEISLVNDDFLSGNNPLKNIRELKKHLGKILEAS